MLMGVGSANLIYGSIFGIFSQALLSSGILLMKKGYSLKGSPQKRKKGQRIWTAGFIINNFYFFPLAGALKFLPPHIVGAFNGVGLVFIFWGTRVFLKEPLHGKTLWLSFLICINVALIGLQKKSLPANGYDPGSLFLFAGFPFLFVLAALVIPWFRKPFVAGALSGIFGSLAVVILDLFVVFEKGVDSFVSRLLLLLLYIIFSGLSFGALQYGYATGRLLSVIPGRYAFILLYPALLSAPALGISVSSLDWALLGLLFLLMSFLALLSGDSINTKRKEP